MMAASPPETPADASDAASSELECSKIAWCQKSRCWLWRSEEHTSELQSQSNLVCRLLLEKKKGHNGIFAGNTHAAHHLPCLACNDSRYFAHIALDHPYLFRRSSLFLRHHDQTARQYGCS